MNSVLDLPDLISRLSYPQRSMLNAHLCIAELRIPDGLISKVSGWYWEESDADSSAAVARACTQQIIRAMNAYTYESTLFNWLRSRRPKHGPAAKEALDSAIEQAVRDCDFCEIDRMTASDTWGRCGGDLAKTASNISKYDEAHGVVIFKNHHPLRFGKTEVQACFQAARAWFLLAAETSPLRRFPFVLWNCLGSAGASIVHGHMQMTLNRVGPYGKQVLLQAAARRYAQDHLGRDYWADWTAAHDSIGLAYEVSDGISIVASMTPVKEKEVIVVDRRPSGPVLDMHLAEAVNSVLRTLIDHNGVTSFNVGIYLPTIDLWDDVHGPIVVRIVDRGDPSPLPLSRLKTSDVGAMELYGASVVASDPFAVIAALRAHA